MAITESLLDIILVSDPSSVRKSGVINNPISNHLPVYVVLKLKSPKISPHYVTVCSYKNYDPENFTFDLASHSDSLLSVFAAPDVNSKFGIFNNAFRQVLDAHAPVKTVKIRSRPCPLVTEEIKDLMKIRAQSVRTQSVHIDSVLSDPLPITHGGPQGAILSSLLFCIYLNHLPGTPQFCDLKS